jgi:hypothetical protein
MGNQIEEEAKKEAKPKKLGQILVRVWDDGIVDSRFFEIDKIGRGPALKVSMDKEEFFGSLRGIIHDAMDDLVLPEHYNYPEEAGPDKAILVGTAQLDIYDDRRIISTFTEIVRTEERGAPKKNSTLSQAEWKRALKSEVGNACDELKLTE